MNDQELDGLFERFRRTGDVPALGAIFDATAPELLRVAMSLVHDPGEADDLLQETFLTAIERSARYESGRRLVPWLLGILVHHARERRALRRRELDPTRLAPREVPAPEAQVLDCELQQELERALAGLPAHARGVLEAYLRQGKGAAEIASESGAAPGAVRMQIHRGLERLRKALPAGLALGSAGAASAQGLTAVRERVLRAGEAAAKELAQGAGSVLGTGMAGVLMGKKLVLIGVLVTLAGSWFLIDRLAGRGGGERDQVARADAPARLLDAAAPERAGPDPAPVAEDVAPAAGGSGRTPLASDAYAIDAAALRGRVVESDGRPVPGVPVALIEVEETQLFPTLFAAVDGPSFPRWLAARTVTDGDGAFELRGATARALHGLGVDLGGARATFRLLDARLAPGATTELGDVVLAATGELEGRVQDEQGRPVAGARVRVGALPEPVLELGLQHVCAGGALTELARGREPYFVIDLPEWTAELEAQLPLATTTTDAEGRFSLRPAAAGGLTAVIDAPGHSRLVSATFDVPAGGRLDLGPLVLEEGASLRGRVVGADGRALAGAEVRAGTAGWDGSLAVFGPLLVSDLEGRFVAPHLPSGCELAVIGRRDALSPWVRAHEEEGEYVVQLAPETELVVEAVDAAGAPVRAPRFFLRPGRGDAELAVLAPPLRPVHGRAREGEPGRWSLGLLVPGHYVVAARAAGLADAARVVELGAGTSPVLRLQLMPSRRTEVVVREKETGKAVSGALVRVFEGRLQPSAAARTDADGRAWIELPLDPQRELWLSTQHPRYAPNGRALDVPSESGTAPLDVQLSSGARLVARLADPVLAERSCMLQLWYEGGRAPHEFHLPRFCAVPREGALELEHLASGDWSWSLFESLAGGEALGFVAPERVPQSLASGKLVLVEGQTCELDISGARQPRSAGVGAVLSGVVRVDGRLAGELAVSLFPLEAETEPLLTEGRGGRFLFEGVPPGRYFLKVSAGAEPGAASRDLVQELIEIAGAEVRELEFDVASIQAHLTVLTADGAPAAGAEVLLLLVGEEATANAHATTDEEGRARPVLPRAGRYMVSVTQREEGAARAELELSEHGANELEVQLSRGVECAGSVRLERGAEFAAASAELLVSCEDDAWWGATCPIELVDGAAAFRFVGLSPGKYRVMLWGGDDALQASFELPEWGAGDLELRFPDGDRR